MRLLLLLLLAACDLQPAPKKSAPAPLPTTPGDGGLAATTPRADGGIATPPDLAVDASVRPAVDAATVVSDACLAVGTHFAEVMIAGATDVAQRAALEQQRTQLVRQMAENCVRQSWNDEVRGCLTGAADLNAMQRCMSLIRPATP